MTADGEKVLCLWIYLTVLQYGALRGILFVLHEPNPILNCDEAGILH